MASGKYYWLNFLHCDGEKKEYTCVAQKDKNSHVCRTLTFLHHTAFQAISLYAKPIFKKAGRRWQCSFCRHQQSFTPALWLRLICHCSMLLWLFVCWDICVWPFSCCRQNKTWILCTLSLKSKIFYKWRGFLCRTSTWAALKALYFVVGRRRLLTG